MNVLSPLIPGLAELPEDTGDCGCCVGIESATPGTIYNRSGLPAVLYRPGSYAEFRRSQIARLSADDHPALARLKGREEEDFTVALIDAWSCVCDILAFYQERSANEAWLGTATERESIIELGRLIGYRPRPGVAASTDLVFLMDDPPNDSATVAAVEIPTGTRIQSIPGPGGTAQTFETVEAIEARVAWNRLVPRQTRPVSPRNGDTGIWLKGVANMLEVGDVIALVGVERFILASGRWDVRRIARVELFAKEDRTWIEWTFPLESVDAALGEVSELRALVFRIRASLFGWNAPHPSLLAEDARHRYDFPDKNDKSDWKFTITGRQIHIDAIQERFVAGGWAVLTRPGVTKLYRVLAAIEDGRAEYAVSARVTRLTLDTGGKLSIFGGTAYRKTSVHGGSEDLAFAESPIALPIQGDQIELDRLVDGLVKGRRLVIRGRRAQAEVVAEGLVLAAGDNAALTKPLTQGMLVVMLAEHIPVAPGSESFVWHLRAPGGFEGFVTAGDAAFKPVPAGKDVELVAEVATLSEAVLVDDTHTLLRLAAVLAMVYDRTSTIVHANVASATHGETTQEVLGGGDPARPFQVMRLKQSPLTYVSAPTVSGTASTLTVRVGETQWHEIETLYGQLPTANVFEARTSDDGSTLVQFGDGVAGARPPSGRNNVVATYRKGIGVAGSVAANTLKTALDRPLGLRDVFNPLPASGGQDPETLANARETAPITTLTMGRVVSLRNYEDFARGFAGIAKARADAVWDGAMRRIVVTVAGPGGEAVDSSHGQVFGRLLDALRTLGDPFVRITLASYRPAYFKLRGKLLINPDYTQEAVLLTVEKALRDAYGFERRGFMRLVASSEVLGTIQMVAGVEGVDLDLLHRMSGSGSKPILHSRLLAEPVTITPDGSILAAEMLTLDPGPIGLEPLA
ncbi:putative baseplate assembly protein [Bradyrhizobium sp. USDA 3458]|uniref:putative baseplate assembly protein n=1 Tax=Bradyrhizobium sp. USDA 3458 TaxID=2591461 RepID=UPI001144C6D1|nr:putative baseplate assembly protein [Bradyrhizobium sp. USDA 3458]